jgi:hypothetical protein
MVEPKNEVTQHASLNRGSGNAKNSDSHESPSPPEPMCAKRQRASGIEDPYYVLEQSVYDH